MDNKAELLRLLRLAWAADHVSAADCRKIDTILAAPAEDVRAVGDVQFANQCDGCQAGIPVEVNQYGTPLHRMGSEGGYPDYMACTAKLYTQD